MSQMPKPAPGDDQSVAMALVNTRYLGPSGPIDELDDPGTVRRWLATRAGAPRNLRLGRRDLERVHALRAAIRDLLSALIEERAPAHTSLDELAAATRAAPSSVRLRSQSGLLVQERVAAGGSPLDRALAVIAGDAIALSGDERCDRLIACGAPDCVRLLLRDHNRRRWCSIQCGDRVRAARYRARHSAGD